jgi:hypothetical protein
MESRSRHADSYINCISLVQISALTFRSEHHLALAHQQA